MAMQHHPGWTNYSEFYQKSDYSCFPQEHRISAGELQFRMIKVQQGAHSFSDPALSESLIALPLVSEPNCIWEWSFGEESFRHTSRPGSMLLVPSDTNSQWHVNASRTLLVLSLPNITVRKILNGACPENFSRLFAPLTRTTWEDPLLEQMLKCLWNGAGSNSVAHKVLCDGLLTSILAQLLLMSDTVLSEQQAISLPAWRINRVRAYVYENLSNEISLNDLALAAGLSVRHFTRNFHKETGETPLKWVMRIRAERAMSLLAQSDLRISEVALMCGFSSQSHLTTTLRQQCGYTPLRWRKLARS